ncbi:hypothetical protein AMTRI_Chr04g180470 [Amborella trichopoda]
MGIRVPKVVTKYSPGSQFMSPLRSSLMVLSSLQLLCVSAGNVIMGTPTSVFVIVLLAPPLGTSHSLAPLTRDFRKRNSIGQGSRKPRRTANFMITMLFHLGLL